MPEHTVWRHGGASTHKWREVYTGPPDKARQKFDKVYRDLRQGIAGVLPTGWHPLDEGSFAQIVRGEDGKLLHTSAPRLRTRW